MPDHNKYIQYKKKMHQLSIYVDGKTEVQERRRERGDTNKRFENVRKSIHFYDANYNLIIFECLINFSWLINL